MNLRPFQIVLFGIFGILALVGILALSVFRGGINEGTAQFGSSVSIWGTFDQDTFDQVLADITSVTPGFNVVQYTQKDPRTFEGELVNAIAEGQSPDLVILPHDLLVKHRAKILPIAYETFPSRAFQDAYIDGAGIFMRSDGIYGLPFAVDPLVMYWNRDLFSSSGLAAPPRTWEELVSVTTPAITRTDAQFNITRSAVAFGEYVNIVHAKSILAMLFLQSGTNIVEEAADRYQITLSAGAQGGIAPGTAALSFYTQFAIPSNVNYSWNRAVSRDEMQFLGGRLGIYFGKGSEYYSIGNQNPNLNFDIARVPQGAGATVLRTHGDFYALSIPRASDNVQGAYQAAYVLSSESASTALVTGLNLAPVQRALIARSTTDPYRQVLYQSALIARGWLDPDPLASENVFRQMTEDVTSGRARAADAVADASQRLQLLFK